MSAALIFIYPGMSVTPARNDVGFVVKPKPIMLAQNLSGGIEGSAVFSHFRQPVVFDLGDIHRRIPRCKSRRGSDLAGDLVGQRFHIITEDGTVIGVRIKVKVAASPSPPAL